jgi:hypothetical protein
MILLSTYQQPAWLVSGYVTMFKGEKKAKELTTMVSLRTGTQQKKLFWIPHHLPSFGLVGAAGSLWLQNYIG